MALPALTGLKGSPLQTVIRVRDIDLGWRNVTGQLKLLDGSRIRIGLPPDGKTSGRYSMDKLIEVGFSNEFGAGSIPERSFVRSAFDENFSSLKLIITFEMNKILSGFGSALRSLNVIGKKVKDDIRGKILTGPFAPLSSRTIAKKGHSTPLIETHQLLNSIQFIARLGR